ncbi:ABC transporter ATP-binding protein [Leuconostoc gasicomitatum]|uniref:ABC transporter ATP-binding protein n=1 Tax=Leuconostoc gasicomitatum TaxID=115778 RepID=UPI001CC57C89|nr:ABC transporter ATP-binding protein [Leuconostoc gasicomitatum]MBR2277419.1 ABC transporter ATP-binding protein [Leuconostoc sp.]MBZ5954501.1 ABC transporter ATP-binding protein [Leuconostoc gasicomitatum]
MEVKFNHVTLTYPNGIEVLHDMDFDINDGQLVALLGPSGGGKSTTLNLISGLLSATTGNIYFGDKDVTKQDALERGVGMVFQNYALYPHMTVLDNIIFPMKMAKIDKATRKQRALDLAKLVRVDDQIAKKPSDLSGGQQQRVAIARALAKSPNILLLDEPLSNLDARLRVEMREEIRRIQKETGVTTIFVTHDQSEAMHVADKIMVLNDGRIQQYDEPQSLYENPSNQFVANFIGEPALNVISARQLGPGVTQLFDGEVATIGIRAEALTNEVKEPAIKMQAIVHEVLSFGRDHQATISVGENQLIATDVTTAALINQEMTLFAALSGVYAFDKEGQRLPLRGERT